MRRFTLLSLVIVACTQAPQPTTTSEASTTSTRLETSTTAAAFEFETSFPTIFYPERSPAYLQGSASVPAEILVNGELVATTVEPILDFQVDVPIAEGSSSLEISAIAGDGSVATKTVEVIFDQELTRQFAYLTDLDLEERTIMVDFADMFVGEEASAAGAEDGVEVDIDYYIRNNDSELRDLPLGPSVEPILVMCLRNGPCPTNRALSLERWEDLMVNSAEWFGRGRLPYWLTIIDEAVVQVEEQYLP